MDSPRGRPLCSHLGCSREARARGLCHTHYQQERRAGTLLRHFPRPNEVRPLNVHGLEDRNAAPQQPLPPGEKIPRPFPPQTIYQLVDIILSRAMFTRDEVIDLVCHILRTYR